MTIYEAISHLDTLKHNTYSDAEKRHWLSRLDGRVHQQILMTHENASGDTFAGYDTATDGETRLLVPPPYDEIYLRYLEAMADYHNGEIEKYNNSIALFEAAWLAYARYYNRTHMPRGSAWSY